MSFFKRYFKVKQMKDYLNYLIEKFPVRRTKIEKENFQKYVKKEITNYQVENQTLEKKHTNIVIGNVEKIIGLLNINQIKYIGYDYK